MTQKDRRLQELRSGADLRSMSGSKNGLVRPETIQRLQRELDAIEGRGYQAVSGNANLKRMRNIKRELHEATREIAAEIERTREDVRYTEQGREEVLNHLRQTLREKIYERMESYNEVEKSFRDGYPEWSGPEIDLSDADAKRLALTLARVPSLSPREFLDEFARAVDGNDRAAVLHLLPVLRSKASDPEYQKVSDRMPIGGMDAVSALTRLGEAVLQTSQSGWKHFASEAAQRTAANLREEAYGLAEYLLDRDGQYAGVGATMKRGDGRSGMTPGLYPLESEAEDFVGPDEAIGPPPTAPEAGS